MFKPLITIISLIGLVRFAVLLSVVLVAPVSVAEDLIEPAYVTLKNQSDYKMMAAVWEDGRDCSLRMENLPPEVDLNQASPTAIVVPSNQEVAVGVGIMEMSGKTPVYCEYIVSFVPEPHQSYKIEYYVRDRRCFALIHRREGGAYQPVLESSSEALLEKMPEFGWDQFEPACS